MNPISIITTFIIGRSKQAIGGEDIANGEMNDWDVLIDLDSQGICGGSIISSQWILTAAHCVFHFEAHKLKLTLGNHYLPSTHDITNLQSNQRLKPASTRKMMVIKKVVHPDYNVALLKFQNEHQSNRHHVSPYGIESYEIQKQKITKTSVWLNANRNSIHLNSGTQLEFQGWGALLPFIGSATKTKQNISIILRNINECKIRQLKEIDVEGSICVNGLCVGDSGSPSYLTLPNPESNLMFGQSDYYDSYKNEDSNEVVVIFGLTSKVLPCGTGIYEDVLTNVANYIPFITEYVEDVKLYYN